MAQSANSAGMQMRERRVRESSYHPMASDSDDGGISDGDPPFYSTGTTHSTYPLQPPPPPPLPSAPFVTSAASSTTASPSYLSSSTTNRGPNVNTDSLAGTTGGASNAVAQPAKKVGKRSFEELEDIVFSNPKSFATLAFVIAESRGVKLIVTDDRTHKVTSAYMHICCVFRKSGCPFILKLTKAKEGGWVLKGAKAIEVDVKQRSVYRCRHPAGAIPEIPPAPSPGSYYFSPQSSNPNSTTTTTTTSATTSYPMSTTVGGGVSKPKAAKARTNSATTTTPTTGYEQYESSIGKVKGSGSVKASLAPVGGYGGTGGEVEAATTIGAADRALAPPFEPSPFERSMQLQAKIVPVLRGGEPTNGFSAPRGQLYDSPPRGSANGRGGGRGSSYEREGVEASTSSLSTVPVIARSDPSSLPDWTRLLTLLSPTPPPSTATATTTTTTTTNPNRRHSRSPSGNSSTLNPSPGSRPSLVPLARVLAHPYMSLTPGSFFDPTTTVEMKLEVLEGLPVDKVGVWNKVWAKKVLMSPLAQEQWNRVVLEKKQSDREGGRFDGPGAGADDDDDEEEDRKSGILSKDDVEMDTGTTSKRPRRGKGGYYTDEEDETGSMYEE